MDELVIRPARPDDVPALTTLLNRIIAVGGTTAMEEEFDEAGFSRLFLTNDDALSCLVAVDPSNGTLAGFQGLARERRLPEGWADIATFARMDNKISGTGRALFAATLQKALSLEVATINAAIRADNRSGLSYYARMGFRTWQVLKAVPLRDGTPVDRVFKRFDVVRSTVPVTQP